MRYTKDECAKATQHLREILSPGQTVYTDLRHVSRSGMQREISVHIVKDGAIQWLTGYVAPTLGERIGKRDGLVVEGCGMDMGFHVVYNLGRTLFPDGYKCSGPGCHSNDHSNGDRNYTPHHHNDGGYAFNHRWI